MILQPNVVNQVEKDTVIFKEQESVTHICMILKGRITAKNKGSKIILTQGNIFGIQDMFVGRYLCDYTVTEDAVIYPFCVDGVSSLERIMAINKDYNGLMVASMCYQIRELSSVAETLRECTDTLYSYVSESYHKYIDYAAQANLQGNVLRQVEELAPYEAEFNTDLKAVDYYSASSRVPLASMKEYYGHSADMTRYQIEQASGVAANLIIECIEMMDYLIGTFSILMNHGEQCLFKNTVSLYQKAIEQGADGGNIMSLIDSMVDEINRMDQKVSRYTDSTLPLNRSRFEEIYRMLIEGNAGGEDENLQALTQSELLESLDGSMQQILQYSTLEKTQKQQLIQAVEYFVSCKDRLSQEEELRNCRKKIGHIFFDLYENVFFHAVDQVKLPKVIELFLMYGFLDERLLTREQLGSIVKLPDYRNGSRLKIYSMFEWLKLIYEGERNPSKNEFDLDYTDYLRDQKKNKLITDEEEARLLSDQAEKVRYEIHNMFAYNEKIVNAQVSTFVPCLYQEMFLNWPEKEYITCKRIQEAFDQVLEIDYSAFYREQLFSDPTIGIDKEYIMQEVYPEMILLPIAGSNGSMWQEISDKRRNNPGRFVFPIFLDTNLNDLMVRLFGRFRWELCRCIQGSAWNNLKHKSLTSEYVDYLQFYRKNRDLSEDKKEKLKLQIQKGRNNSREVFVLDYEAWIKGESNGAIRLNKVSREFLATYCPFSKPIRERLKQQPMFAEAFTRHERERVKKMQELENRIRARRKEQVEPTKAIEDTLVFYKEM